MTHYAWYYRDHENDICYWTYSSEMSCTYFAEKVSRYLDSDISASDTSYASSADDLDRHLRGMRPVYING